MGCGRSKEGVAVIVVPESNDSRSQRRNSVVSIDEYIEGEKNPQEIQSANTLRLTSPTHNNDDNNNNNNNNNKDFDYTDNSSTFVIGQIIDPATTVPQDPSQMDKNGDNTQSLTTKAEEGLLTADNSQQKGETGTPVMRKISVCLEGTLVCEGTYMVFDSGTRSGLMLEQGSEEDQPDSHGIPREWSGQVNTSGDQDSKLLLSEPSTHPEGLPSSQDSKLSSQPSTSLKVPASSSPERSAELEEEKTAVVRYRKSSLQSQPSLDLGAVSSD